MHWQEACEKSKYKIAYIIKDGKYIRRFWNGVGQAADGRGSGNWRLADLDEIEEYSDWEPVE